MERAEKKRRFLLARYQPEGAAFDRWTDGGSDVPWGNHQHRRRASGTCRVAPGEVQAGADRPPECAREMWRALRTRDADAEGAPNEALHWTTIQEAKRGKISANGIQVKYTLEGGRRSDGHDEPTRWPPTSRCGSAGEGDSQALSRCGDDTQRATAARTRRPASIT